jgi:ABC-type phosphonate transport system ATPase subunit
MSALLDIKAITCRYDARTIFSDLSFSVAPGSIACLLAAAKPLRCAPLPGSSRFTAAASRSTATS